MALYQIPIGERAEFWQVGQRIEAGAAGGTRVSLASYDVLLRTGNPLIKGEMPEDGTPEFTSAIMGFVFTHCANWPEVVRASFNDQGFRESALIFCAALSPADFQTAFKRLEEQSRELEAAQVETTGDIGGKKPLPVTNQVS